MYYLWVNVTFNLISGLVFRTIMTKMAWNVLSGVPKNGMGCFVPECFVRLPAHLLYSLRKSVPSHFRVTVTLTSYLVVRICLESSAYHSYFWK